MKIQCDACESAEASVFCCADEAVLCSRCDSRVHQTNKLACKHHRVSMADPDSPSAELPRCDICQERSAFFFCQEDRAVLCRDCDFSVHSANAMTAKHCRFLVSGIRVSLRALEIPDEEDPPASPESPQKKKKKARKKSPCDGDNNLRDISMAEKDPTATATGLSEGADNPSSTASASNPVNSTSSQTPIAGGMSGSSSSSSISEYLTQTLPGWRIEEFLGSDSPEHFEWPGSEHGSPKVIVNLGDELGKLLDQDWTADLEFPREGIYVEGEVPQMPSPPTASGMCRYGGFGDTLDDIFMVPDMAPAGPPSKRMRPHFQI